MKNPIKLDDLGVPPFKETPWNTHMWQIQRFSSLEWPGSLGPLEPIFQVDQKEELGTWLLSVNVPPDSFDPCWPSVLYFVYSLYKYRNHNSVIRNLHSFWKPACNITFRMSQRYYCGTVVETQNNLGSYTTHPCGFPHFRTREKVAPKHVTMKPIILESAFGVDVWKLQKKKWTFRFLAFCWLVMLFSCFSVAPFGTSEKKHVDPSFPNFKKNSRNSAPQTSFSVLPLPETSQVWLLGGEVRSQDTCERVCVFEGISRNYTLEN